MRHLHLLGLIALAGSGCSDHAYDPDGPAIDPNAPKIHITSPDRGTVAGDVHTVKVTGTATDDEGVKSVAVNGVAATLAPDGSWSVDVPVVPGTNLLHAVAADAQNNTGNESRAVVAGPMQGLGMHVPAAITATLSAQTFAAIGQGAEGYIKTADLEALVGGGTSPVIHAGDPSGPDCLYGEAFITSISVGDAHVKLTPQKGGLALAGELDQLKIGMHLQYAAVCIDGSRDITVAASKITVSGNLAVALANGQFDIHLDSPNVGISGLDLNLGGIPGAVVDLLHLDSALGPVLGWAVGKFVAPMVNKSFTNLTQTKTIQVLNGQVDLDIKPSKLDFSADGAIVQLDTSVRARGDSGKFVMVPNTVPAMDLSHGFQLAVADDALNQALTSMWSAKVLDDTIMLKNVGSYGEVGKLYDSVSLQTAAPPFVDASGDGLVLTIGDVLASFKNGTDVVTAIAFNAQVDLKVVTGEDGALRFDVGTPTVYVDILDEGVEGANELSNSNFEALSSFALTRVVAVGAGSVGTIPLPAAGGVAVKDLALGVQTGYVVVAGEIQ